ncbi:MerR family transcriptional regulator [Acinetobacter sp. C_4_1]|nr:MerR family transcriptional regulator [Acinetobacter sp. F_3_1]MCT8099465.1 MerR family transcriptional regulator [Acinetobacter sp. C_3_1]MCT8102545.1 MerR family transcriptional regulator [Acinetobacter sp. C_4_1]MCT8136277.1 MerR family transcriptional regulator [Acinetobacter sp. T_3_1]
MRGALHFKSLCNKADVNELIDLHVSAIRENIIKQQKLIEQLSDLRGTCDGLCTIDQCGVLKNLA